MIHGRLPKGGVQDRPAGMNKQQVGVQLPPSAGKESSIALVSPLLKVLDQRKTR